MSTIEPTYKVFEVETTKSEKFPDGKGFQIFWCPSTPIHFNDKIPYSPKVYPYRQSAYRKCKTLNDEIKTKAGC